MAPLVETAVIAVSCLAGVAFALMVLV